MQSDTLSFSRMRRSRATSLPSRTTWTRNTPSSRVSQSQSTTSDVQVRTLSGKRAMKGGRDTRRNYGMRKPMALLRVECERSERVIGSFCTGSIVHIPVKERWISRQLLICTRDIQDNSFCGVFGHIQSLTELCKQQVSQQCPCSAQGMMKPRPSL